MSVCFCVCVCLCVYTYVCVCTHMWVVCTHTHHASVHPFSDKRRCTLVHEMNMCVHYVSTFSTGESCKEGNRQPQNSSAAEARRARSLRCVFPEPGLVFGLLGDSLFISLVSQLVGSLSFHLCPDSCCWRSPFPPQCAASCGRPGVGQAPGDGSEIVIDEEEFEYIQRLKEMKRTYRDVWLLHVQCVVPKKISQLTPVQWP